MDVNKLKKIIMGTEEAAKLWELSQDHVKKLCRTRKCKALQIGKTWIIIKDQPNPASKQIEKGELERND